MSDLSGMKCCDRAFSLSIADWYEFGVYQAWMLG